MPWLVRPRWAVLAAPVALAMLWLYAQDAPAQCQRAKLTASDGAADDWFGYAVAVSGDVAVIGALYHDYYGAAHVFERSGADWLQVAELALPNGGGLVGWSVAVERYRAVVGAKLVWTQVYECFDGVWSRVAWLRPDDYVPASLFGQAVALSGDVAVVGAPEDNGQSGRSGAAHVFERDPNGAWPQMAKLVAEDGSAFDYFGDAVAIDGDVIAVGAQDDDPFGFNSGSAYVFERDPNGVWSQAAKLLPHDGGTLQSFGFSVGVSADVVMVGAPSAHGNGDHEGAVYVFERDASGAWPEVGKLIASDGTTSDFLGVSVDVEGDLTVVGASGVDDLGDGTGAAYVFAREREGAWVEVAKLTADDGAAWDRFGKGVGLSGNVAVIGAPEADALGTDSGSAYVFAVGPDNDGDGIMDVCLCPGDLDHDLDVDLADLAQLLTNYGMTSGATYEDGDLDEDGDVDLADLAALLSVYGETCY